jgi:hypothetical protein
MSRLLMKLVFNIGIRVTAAGLALGTWALPAFGAPSPEHTPCFVQSTKFEGWNAVEVSNDWVRLEIVPQLGGRLIQVSFGDHAYLFVNPKYKGQYLPPSAARNGEWFNYGGDKLWPLPEGHGEGEWPGPIADPLDDGEYKSTILSQGQECKVHLEGPGDPATGLQYSRDISIRYDSPQISFHASMKNISNHLIRWSMESVTQYDTADVRHPENYNRGFWALIPVKAASTFPNGYFVRTGLADDPSFEVRNGLFKLHWLYLQNEVWLDSDAGWMAVIDDTSRYGMIETFHHSAGAEYPGKASIIFYKNGGVLTLDERGMPALRSNNPHDAPYYMEAEINSPLIDLAPGSSYAMDTEWFPTRTSKELSTVTPVGIIAHPLTATSTSKGIELCGSFGVLFPGKLVAHVLDAGGAEVSIVGLTNADPLIPMELNQTIELPEHGAAVSLRLTDEQGTDRGELSRARIIR